MRRLSDRVSRVCRVAALSVMIGLPLGACATTGVGSQLDQGESEGFAASSGAPTSVVVMNNSFDKVTVYVAQGQTEWRLGEVEPVTERTLALNNAGPALLGRSAHFIGRRFAGGVVRSEEFNVEADGGVPRWTIENYAAFSYVRLR